MGSRGILLSVVCVMAMASVSLATAVPNSSFEDGANNNWVTSIPDWTLLPAVPSTNVYRAGLFMNFDGYTATKGQAFAVITHRNQGTQGLISADMTLVQLDHYLTFDYQYVTKNVPGDAVHVDPFTVHLMDADAITPTELANWTVSDTDDSDLALGGISSTPWGPGPSGTPPVTYETGWQTFTVDLHQYAGSNVYFEFRQNDSAQQGGGSGFFLDNIRVAPEPGTFLLFGVGALGLMLYGRRKVRLKK